MAIWIITVSVSIPPTGIVAFLLQDMALESASTSFLPLQLAHARLSSTTDRGYPPDATISQRPAEGEIVAFWASKRPPNGLSTPTSGG